MKMFRKPLLLVFLLYLLTSSLLVVAADAFKNESMLLASPLFLSAATNKRDRPYLVEPRTSSRNVNIRGGAKTNPTLLSIAPIVFDSTPLIQSASIFTLVNVLGFIFSLVGKTQIHVDLLGTGAFALAAIPTLVAKGAVVSRVKLSAAAMALWSIKLASFLLFRIVKFGEDKRLTDYFSSASGTAGFWIFSLLWGLLCSLPHTLGSASSAPGTPFTTLVGLGMYAIGLIIETTADYQKWIFKTQNPGKFCNAGLWSISQHPNWFGNILIWAGILILNAPALIESVPVDSSFFYAIWGFRRLVLACLSPAFMWYLFNGQANGSLTSTTGLAKKKYGSDPEYIQYVETVNKIIPKLF